jgi:protein-tyrosine-phosphatase
MDEKERVLFVCEDNTRSHMAEALLRHHAGDRFEVLSAGIWPRAVDERVRTALRGFGVSDEQLQSRAIESLWCQRFDFVITLCELAEFEPQVLPAARVLLRWHFRDPHEEEEKHAGAFVRCVSEINERIKMLLLILSKPEIGLPNPQLGPRSGRPRVEAGAHP